MAEKKSLKIAQISKDFNVKTKDILDIFKDAGIEKKSGAAVESEEYELFLHIATSTHQIKNIDDYLDGVTKITVVNEKEEAKAEPKPEVKAEPKAEPKPEAKAVPEVKAEPKVEKKPEVKPQPDRAQQKKNDGKPSFEQRPRQPQQNQ